MAVDRKFPFNIDTVYDGNVTCFVVKWMIVTMKTALQEEENGFSCTLLDYITILLGRCSVFYMDKLMAIDLKDCTDLICMCLFKLEAAVILIISPAYRQFSLQNINYHSQLIIIN